MIRTGLLTITAGISRPGSTRLVKEPLGDRAFRNATDFLRQERQLESGEIFALRFKSGVTAKVNLEIVDTKVETLPK
jgi:hypothetical protein